MESNEHKLVDGCGLTVFQINRNMIRESSLFRNND